MHEARIKLFLSKGSVISVDILDVQIFIQQNILRAMKLLSK